MVDLILRVRRSPQEDRDNYSDIILAGDEPARSLRHVEIPSPKGGYAAFYNPGGPGPETFDGVRYTAPGPPDLEPITLALDDPMRVSRDVVVLRRNRPQADRSSRSGGDQQALITAEPFPCAAPAGRSAMPNHEVASSWTAGPRCSFAVGVR